MSQKLKTPSRRGVLVAGTAGAAAVAAPALLKQFFAERRAQIKAQRDARQAAMSRQALHGLDVIEPDLEQEPLPLPQVIDGDDPPSP